MKVKQLLEQENLERSILIGYYGGGNYGDELLLEVLQNLFSQKGVKETAIAYQNPSQFTRMHRDFGYTPFLIHDIKSVLKHTFRAKNVIIGGGGLWGLDINLNTFLLGPYLFFCRWFLRKKIFLLGVGYYNSTTTLGHIGAWFAAKAANAIITRDNETYKNFSRYSKRTHLDNDLAWFTSDVDQSLYAGELAALEGKLTAKKNTLVISLRRFKAKHQNNYASYIPQIVAQNQDKNIILLLLENKEVDPESADLISELKAKYTNVQAVDYQINPMALFAFFSKHRADLTLVGPQFHIIITAYLNGIPFMPISYDNKVTELFNIISIPESDRVSIYEMSAEDIQAFIKNNAR